MSAAPGQAPVDDAATGPSLFSRLVRAAALWFTLALVIVGVLLASMHRATIERAFDQRLHVYLKTLVANLVVVDDIDNTALGDVGEPRFSLPLSGWYWQVTRRDGTQGAPDNTVPATRASRSLFDQTLPLLIDIDPVTDTTFIREAYVDGPDGQRLRLVERVIDFGQGRSFIVSVAGDASEIAAETYDFNVLLALSFALLALGLVLSTVLQVRYGLRPLERIYGGIVDIRAGRAERITGTVPREIAPLAHELNALIAQNRGIVERARTHVGNLAHALKTPLAVLANEVDGRNEPLAEKVREQTGVMRGHVDHYLERARIAAGVAMAGAVVPVRPVVEGLARTMEKVHRDKGVTIETSLEDIRFRGERQDLEEVLGNLVDNACKWAKSRVEITVVADAARTEADRDWLVLSVEDDGPGLTPEECVAARGRGRRLDETRPGSGLGLSIVSDTVMLYGGTFVLEKSGIGGLCARVRLPAVRE